MKKTKTSALKVLWDRASKAQKTSSTSTPQPPLVESQIQSNPAPIELELQMSRDINGGAVTCSEDGGEVPSTEDGAAVPIMDDQYEPVIKSKRYKRKISNLHRFRVEIFLSVIDRQLRELNDRFDEVNTELLICMGSFNPSDSFAAYDKDQLLKLAQFYPMDFSSTDLVSLKYQLAIFINDMRKDKRFRKVKDLGELSVMLVRTDKSRLYPLVYKLLKLVLILPVATASVERIFSVMNLVKNKLRNRMGDQLLNGCMITFIERELFKQVKDKAVISRFQSMKERIVKL